MVWGELLVLLAQGAGFPLKSGGCTTAVLGAQMVGFCLLHFEVAFQFKIVG